jgi:hypothetical protein
MFWSGRAATAIPAPLRDTLGPYTGWLASQAAGESGYFDLMFARALSLVNRVVGLFFLGSRVQASCGSVFSRAACFSSA